jgi:oligogalacturonide transporter
MKKNFIYEPKEINIKRGIGFGMLDLLGGGWNNIVSGVIFTFLLSQGIGPAESGAITGIGRIVDAIFSLFIGGITDNFYKTKLGKRFGRRHFFIFVGAILLALVFPLFWLPVGNFAFYLGVYIAIEIIIAFILIPWETLPTEMTDDYKLRTVLSGTRMFISAIGTTLVFIILAVLKNSDTDNAYVITGSLYTVIFVVAILISWRSTWEKSVAEVESSAPEEQHLSAFGAVRKNVTDYFSTFKNKSFRKHLSVYLFSFTGKDFYATMLPTFIVYSIGLTAGDSFTLLALAAIGIPATLVASKLMISKGPRFLFTSCFSLIILSMIGYAAVYFIHIDNPFIVLIIISLFYQVGRAVLEFTPWNVFPFIPDVDYIMTREHRAGIYAAVMTFFRKSTGAVASWIAGILLEVIGFKAADKELSPLAVKDYAENLPDAVQDGITWIFFIAPVLLIGIALVIAQSFRLNRQTHDILKEEIHRLENGGAKAAATKDAKEVCERLTGHPYSTLWPEIHSDKHKQKRTI